MSMLSSKSLTRKDNISSFFPPLSLEKNKNTIMKTKSLHFLLFIAVILCSTSISAANVARIGTTNYESLSDAIEAARNGQTVTILADITGNVLVDNQSFSNGESIIVDMSDHTLTGNLHLMINNGTITIKNGTVSGTICGADAENPGTINYSAAVVLENIVASAVHADGHDLKLQGGVYDNLINSYALGTEQMNTIILDNPDNYMSTMNIPGDYARGPIKMQEGRYTQEYYSSTISFVDGYMIVYSWTSPVKNGQTYIFEMMEKVPEVDNCYMISTPLQLLNFSKLVASEGIVSCKEGENGHIAMNAKVLNDLDMSGVNFLPIGLFTGGNYIYLGYDVAVYYDGVFDGGGHVISNLDVSWSDVFRDAAMFGRTGSSAVIKNINMNGVSARGYVRAAGLVGVCYGSTIFNCSLLGNNSFAADYGHFDGGLIYEVKGDVPTTLRSSYTFDDNLILVESTSAIIANSFSGSDARSKAPSGELCYLLNNRTANYVYGGWRQNIDVDGVASDEYPIYGVEGHSLVYFDEARNTYTNTMPEGYVQPGVLLRQGVPVPVCQPVTLHSTDEIQFYAIGQISPNGTTEIFPVSVLDEYVPGAAMAKNHDMTLATMSGADSFIKYPTLWDGSVISIDPTTNSWEAELVDRSIVNSNSLSFVIVDPENINITVNVENRDVHRYFTEVDYSEDISTAIDNYIIGDMAQDLPQSVCIPLSDSSSYIIKNLTPGVKTPFEVVDSNGKLYKGVINPTGTVRMIEIGNGKHTKNMRDLGGKTTQYGGKIKYGKLFRNTQMDYNTDEENQEMLDLGIGAEIDLRGDGDSYHGISVFGFTEEEGNYMYANIGSSEYNSMEDDYGHNLFRKEIELIVDNLKKGHAVDFHCAAGADRTGLLGAMICALLGCSMNDIYKEFELTCFCPDYRWRNTDVARGRFVDPIMSIYKGNTFNEKVEDYYLNYAGLSPDVLDEFRSLMIEGYNGNTDSDNTDISQYDNIVYADNVEVIKSDLDISNTVILPVNLKNVDDNICGIQFDLTLPDGVNVAKTEKGSYLVKLSTERTSSDEHDVLCSLQSDGTLRIVCTSFDNKPFGGNDGTILNVSLNIANDIAAGKYSVILKNIVMTNSVPAGYKVKECRSSLTVKDFLMGDVNLDGTVDVIDVAGIVEYALGNDPAGLFREAADVNRDGNINVTDVSATINIILYGTYNPSVQRIMSASPRNASSLVAASVTVSGNESVILPVYLTSSTDDIISFQADVTLPQGVNVAAVTSSTGHTVKYSLLPDGSIRIACFSLANKTFPGNGAEVLKLNLNVDNSAETGVIRVDNIVLTRSDITCIHAENTTSKFELTSTTSVGGIDLGRSNRYYDLHGRIVSDVKYSQPGIYINERGKKTVR